VFTYFNIFTGNPLGVIPSTSELLDANIRQFQSVGEDHHPWQSATDLCYSRAFLPFITIVFLGEGLPVISADLLKQIQNEEYIDFADLPPCRGDTITSLPRFMKGKWFYSTLEMW